MAYFEEGSEAMVALEVMVDRAGMANVLYALAHIAAMKAGHIECNWQDQTLAKEWYKTGDKLDRFARDTFHFHQR
jgi:hypothetical protein